MNETSKREKPPEKESKKTAEVKKGKLEIKNKLRQPLVVTLSKNKTIVLGPRGKAQISAKDLESPVLQKFIKQRKVIVFGK